MRIVGAAGRGLIWGLVLGVVGCGARATLPEGTSDSSGGSPSASSSSEGGSVSSITASSSASTTTDSTSGAGGAPPAPPWATSISVGFGHACAIKVGGEVVCWGGNGEGQLGDGTTMNRSVPTPVVGLPGDIVQVSAGFEFTLALTSDGDVYGWGENGYDEMALGVGMQPEHLNTPTKLLSLPPGIRQVSAGGNVACAITHEGAVICWGLNEYGVLGVGTGPIPGGTEEPDGSYVTPVPVEVIGLSSGASAVSAGATSACAINAKGGVVCWGSDQGGGLGDKDAFLGGSSTGAVQVSGITSGATSISVEETHACAVVDGGVRCWGLGSNGQNGNGSDSEEDDVPVNAQGLGSGVLSVNLGEQDSCAVTEKGALFCWGANLEGEFGVTGVDTDVPVEVDEGANIAAVSTGEFSSCRLSHSGHVSCAGDNGAGELGNGSQTNSTGWTSVVEN